MEHETIQAAVQTAGGIGKRSGKSVATEKDIQRLKQETQALEIIAYALLSVVGVFSLFALLGVDFGTSFDKAPLLLLMTSCMALTFMTRKNKLARLEAEAAETNSSAGQED